MARTRGPATIHHVPSSFRRCHHYILLSFFSSVSVLLDTRSPVYLQTAPSTRWTQFPLSSSKDIISRITVPSLRKNEQDQSWRRSLQRVPTCKVVAVMTYEKITPAAPLETRKVAKTTEAPRMKNSKRLWLLNPKKITERSCREEACRTQGQRKQ